MAPTVMNDKNVVDNPTAVKVFRVLEIEGDASSIAFGARSNQALFHV